MKRIKSLGISLCIYTTIFGLTYLWLVKGIDGAHNVLSAILVFALLISIIGMAETNIKATAEKPRVEGTFVWLKRTLVLTLLAILLWHGAFVLAAIFVVIWVLARAHTAAADKLREAAVKP